MATRTPTADCKTSELFDVLWSQLADVIGPTATAALMQRSIKRAMREEPELGDLIIARDGFMYTYTTPASWSEAGTTSHAALLRVVSELWPLLSELTGMVVIRRLREQPLLRKCGVIPGEVSS